MKKFTWLLGCAPLFLAACEEFDSAGNDRSGQFIKELPAGVRAIAAPYQDLTAVRVDPASGCYSYRHVGPVETTFLPLRTAEGRPICAKPAQAPPAV
ncbi:MAG TPA: hypothetical protein VIN05_12820 [Roseovarius sp.]